MEKELNLYEDVSIVKDSCKFTPTSLNINKDLPIEDWENIGGLLKNIDRANQWWLGDWMNYGEGKYGEMYSQALEATDYEYGTLRNLKWVAENIKMSSRRDNLSFKHHTEVAKFSPELQDEFLKKAEENKWSVSELRDSIKLSRKVEEIPLPSGKYSVIYADPPWDVKAGPEYNSGGESRDLEYPTMSLKEIEDMPVESIAGDNAHLYLWTINKYIEDSYRIARKWGFEPTCLLTWCKKPHGIGLGGTFIQTTEHLLFCRKGTLTADKRIDTTWWQYKRGKHSVKPMEFRKMIEEVSPGKRIELFAREKSEGWDVWGNEVK